MAGTDGSSPASDKSLLERLNALKPSAVALEPDPIRPASITKTAPPPSPADALSARLRTLRNSPSPSASPEPVVRSTPLSSPLARRDGSSLERMSAPQRPLFAEAEKNDGGDLDADVPFLADDRGVDDLLDELERDGGVFDDDLSWEPLAQATESRKVAALLDELREEAVPGCSAAASKKPESQGQGSREDNVGDDDDDDDDDDKDDDDDDDDSEGERMSRKVDQVVSQARDEAEMDRPPSESDLLPKKWDTSQASDSHEEDPGVLQLPTVPSTLVDPSPSAAEDGEGGDDPDRAFENEIVVRMASLKGLGAGVNLDSFGLPSVPTFQPGDHVPAAATRRTRAAGYTDEDQKRWCVVCLEDAAIRCVGCDDDAFCARCWKEMHVGPSAGYEERGHQWVKMERRDGS